MSSKFSAEQLNMVVPFAEMGERPREANLEEMDPCIWSPRGKVRFGNCQFTHGV